MRRKRNCVARRDVMRFNVAVMRQGHTPPCVVKQVSGIHMSWSGGGWQDAWSQPRGLAKVTRREATRESAVAPPDTPWRDLFTAPSARSALLTGNIQGAKPLAELAKNKRSALNSGANEPTHGATDVAHKQRDLST